MLLVAVGVVSFVLRVWAPGPVTETTDEPLWLKRSDAFRTALVDGQLRHATAAHHIAGVENDTMPGVTTMWASTIGRNVADLAGRVGVIERPTGPSDREPDVLRLSRAVVALWCSLALVLFTYLATRLVGRAPGIVAGALLATEPWLVGLSNLLHTDAMVTMFSACSISALAVAVALGREASLDVGRHRAARKRWPSAPPHLGWLVVAGLFAGLATLTKVNALAILAPGAAVVVLAAMWHGIADGGRPSRPEVARRTLGVAGVWLAVGLVTIVVAWPALWVAPGAQLTDIRQALHQVDEGHPQFFRGVVTKDPGSWFYPVTFAFRTAPWTLLGTIAVLAVIVVRSIGALVRRPRLAGLASAMPTWPAVVCLPYVALIMWSPKKLDRYVSPILPMLALLIGVLAVVVCRALAERFDRPGALAPIATLASVVAILLCLVQAPYAISYVDPLLGQRRASHTMLLGWSEGVERLGAEIADRENGHCREVRVVVSFRRHHIAVPCGQIHQGTTSRVLAADYAITYINQRQRGGEAGVRETLRRIHAVMIDRTTIGGVSYAELWKVPHPERAGR